MTSENYFEELNKLSENLKGLDERGLVLSLAAFAEDSLSTLLKAYMFDNAATKKLVDGFDAPLGTLSSRIRAAYALGLITKGQYNDLEHLRTIRNMFSHTWQSISFLDATVNKHINALNYSNVVEKFPETPREKLEGTISFLLVEINAIVNQISKNWQRPHRLGSRLYSGITGTPEEQIVKCKEKCEYIKNELISAKAEKKEFYNHLRKCWVEKYFRAIAHNPKEKQSEHLLDLLSYATREEISFSNMYYHDL
jgi:DNA-binding MltR family transcriptional regulator